MDRLLFALCWQDNVIRETLAALRHPVHVKPHEEEIIHSLQGNWKADILFELQQAVEAYDFYRKQIATCDLQLKAYIALLLTQKVACHVIARAISYPPTSKRSNSRKAAGKPKGNQPAFDLRAEMERILGVNAIPR